MTTYIVRRLLTALPVLFGITILVFLFLALAPGDPVSAYINPELGQNEVVRQIIIKRYGLDQPLPVRYVSWLVQALQGNLGYTAVAGLPVLGTVVRGLTASAVLIGTALSLGIIIGLPLGVISALRQYSKLDFTLTTLAFLGISTPSFLLAILGLWLFGLELGVFPIGDMQTAGAPFTLGDFAAHLALPALVLGLGYIAILTRYTRSAMLEVVRSPYVTTAESKGLVPRVVIIRHAFRNALIPILTVIGLSLPDMVGGAVITETVFTWPGMGLLMVQGVVARDYPLIMGVSLFVAIGVLAANLLTDVAYAVADPRIRY
ncbi:MAG TPA: ABC transporter permease [Acidimicrobiales bacterium]|nr:ABC transporter permease [Acidimicrobiales bacterium]